VEYDIILLRRVVGWTGTICEIAVAGNRFSSGATCLPSHTLRYGGRGPVAGDGFGWSGWPSVVRPGPRTPARSARSGPPPTATFQPVVRCSWCLQMTVSTKYCLFYCSSVGARFRDDTCFFHGGCESVRKTPFPTCSLSSLGSVILVWIWH